VGIFLSLTVFPLLASTSCRGDRNTPAPTSNGICDAAQLAAFQPEQGAIVSRKPLDTGDPRVFVEWIEPLDRTGDPAARVRAEVARRGLVAIDVRATGSSLSLTLACFAPPSETTPALATMPTAAAAMTARPGVLPGVPVPRPSPSQIVFPPRTPDPASRFRRLDPEKIYVWGSLKPAYEMVRGLGSLEDPRNPATGFPSGSFGGAIRPSDGRFVYLDREGTIRVFTPEETTDPPIDPSPCPLSGRATSVMFDTVTGELYAGCKYQDVASEILHRAGQPVMIPLPEATDWFFVTAPPVNGALFGRGLIRGKRGHFVSNALAPREPVTVVGPTGAATRVGADRSGWNLFIGDADKSAVKWRIAPAGTATRVADLGGHGKIGVALPNGELAQAFYTAAAPVWDVTVKIAGERGTRTVYFSPDWKATCENTPCVHFYDYRNGTQWIQLVTAGIRGDEWGL
jgi:hypothetical protein